MGFCPLIKDECLKEECMWWESSDRKCAVLKLAYTTDISGILEKLTESMSSIKYMVRQLYPKFL
jgi:hypothetical protein